MQKQHYHKTDEWRGYSIPANAVAGSSYTGEWSDSPAKESEVKPELDRLRSYLKEHGILSRIKATPSSNVFMTKLWVIVDKSDYRRAHKLANEWLKENEENTSHIHDAED